MHNFRRVISGLLLFVFLCVSVSALIIAPALMPDSIYNDSAARIALAGTIDTIYCGASQALGAFIPAIIDESAGTSSYNLSSYAASQNGKRTVLIKELERNPVDTVILEVAYDTVLTSASELATGEAMIICKLDSTEEKLRYFSENIRFWNGDFDNVYAVFMRYGLNAWKARLKGELNIPQNNRGYIPNPVSDISIPDERLLMLKDTDSIGTEYSIDVFQKLTETVTACQERGAKVIITVVPLAESILWENDGWDIFLAQMQRFCEETDCTLLDFNLLRERVELFSDSSCFKDEVHLGDAGAKAFSAAFADVLAKLNSGEDISALFYPSYAEAKTHFFG